MLVHAVPVISMGHRPSVSSEVCRNYGNMKRSRVKNREAMLYLACGEIVPDAALEMWVSGIFNHFAAITTE